MFEIAVISLLLLLLLFVYFLLRFFFFYLIQVSSWFGGIHALVVGPGLGREEKSLSQAANLIELWKKTDQPLVLDADILFLLNSRSELIKGYRKAILTPNKNEYDRLYKAIFNEDAPTREIGSKRVSSQLA